MSAKDMGFKCYMLVTPCKEGEKEMSINAYPQWNWIARTNMKVSEIAYVGGVIHRDLTLEAHSQCAQYSKMYNRQFYVVFYKTDEQEQILTMRKRGFKLLNKNFNGRGEPAPENAFIVEYKNGVRKIKTRKEMLNDPTLIGSFIKNNEGASKSDFEKKMKGAMRKLYDNKSRPDFFTPFGLPFVVMVPLKENAMHSRDISQEHRDLYRVA